MPNEDEYSNPAEETEETSVAEAPTPTNLSEAFEILKKQNSNVDSGNEEEGESDGESDGETEPESDSQEYNDEGSDVGGGSADEFDGFDPNDSISSILNQVQKRATEEAYNDFKSKNYRKITVMDLRQEDEQGNVTYLNPDNQRRNFESRMEAQQWVDSFNKQVDIDFRAVSQQYEQKLLETARPTLQMLDFVPVYQKMSAEQQDIMDDLIEPYEIKSSDGTVIGYKCNLVSMAKQAINMSNKINEKYSRKSEIGSRSGNTATQDVGRPATDLKSRGSSDSSVGDPEPKNLQEAMALYQKQQREKRSK